MSRHEEHLIVIILKVMIKLIIMHAGNKTLLLTYIYIYCILFIKYISDSLVTGIETDIIYLTIKTRARFVQSITH